MMSQGLVTMSYIGASILFILSLSGLSNQETARRGNYYGMAGMAIAIFATIFSSIMNDYSTLSYEFLIGALVIGGFIGTRAALKVEMTQMPELVAAMHSLVGLAAMLVGYISFMDESTTFTDAEKTIHQIKRPDILVIPGFDKDVEAVLSDINMIDKIGFVIFDDNLFLIRIALYCQTVDFVK